MPVRFVLGRAGTGKTHRCLAAVAARLAGETPTADPRAAAAANLAEAPDDRKLILLVPEQASLQMERALVRRAPRGGYWRAEVLSFTRLAQRVFDAAGSPPGELSPQARRMALRIVAQSCGPALTAFGSAATTPGFYAELDRIIEELLTENVTPEQLLRCADPAGRPGALTPPPGDRLAAIATIYAAYREWLGTRRTDPAARLAALRERLERTDWLRDSSIWVDGFAGFTGQEQATLVALARVARELEISLLLDPAALTAPPAGDAALRLFARTETTYQRLRAAFDEAGVPVDPPVLLDAASPPRFASADLASLERALASADGDPRSSSDGSGRPDDAPTDARSVCLVECPTHREELREAARRIRTLVIDAGGSLRFRDFAVIARDLTRLAPIVAEVFEEFEVPYFLDQRRSIATHALCRLVHGLLDAATTDCDGDAMVRLLRSGLVLEREAAEELENIVLLSQVRGLEAWRRDRWDFGPDAPVPPWLDGVRPRIVRSVEGLHALGRAGPAARRPGAAPPEPSVRGRDWTRQLLAALDEIGAPRRLESWIDAAHAAGRLESAETHRLAWEALCELLDDIDDVLGDTRLTGSEFSEIVAAGLRDLSLGLAPPTLDQVLVGSIERSRHPEIRYAWIVAVNQGIFPRPPEEDGLLSTADREALAEKGLAGLRSRRDDALAERLLAYIACTRPSHGLTISFARADAAGEPLAPSPLLEDLRRALPGLACQTPDAARPPAALAECARGYLRHVPRRDEFAPRYRRVADALAKSDLGPRLTWLLRGASYDNLAPPLRRRSRPDDGDGPDPADEIAWRGSPSEIESYIQCPYKHFAEYRLRLSARRGPPLIEWELGQAAHEILAEVTRRAIDGSTSVRAIPDSRWCDLLDAVLDEQRAARPADLPQRRPHAAFLYETLGAMLRETLLAHAERWRRGQFEPLAVEHKFGTKRTGPDDLPALPIPLPDGRRALLEGRIDRLDRASAAGGVAPILVYDYKSTAAGLDGPFLTGARLACFAYLLAVENAYAAEGRPVAAGALIAPLYPNVRALRTNYARTADATTQRLVAFRPRGLFDDAVAALLDEAIARAVQAAQQGIRPATPFPPSPVVAVRVKNDGTIHAQGDARPASDIAARLDLARSTIAQAAEGLAAGQIGIEPLVERRTLACRTCDFQAVCRFDPQLNHPRDARYRLPVLDAS